MDNRYIDKTASFNGDFYTYATGNWKKFHKQPDDEPRWSQFDVLDRQVTDQLKEIITSLDETNPFQKKMKDYFRMFTDYDRRNREKAEPLRKYIEKIRGFTTKDEILRYVVEELDSEFFISIALAPDEKDPDWYKVHT